MKGGVDEQAHVVQDEGAVDVDADAAAVALELPGIESAGGRQADVAAAVMREVLRFDRDAVVSEVGRASDDHHPQIRADAQGDHIPGDLSPLPDAGVVLFYPDIKVEVSIEPALTDIVIEQYDAGIRQGRQIARDMIALRIGPDLRMVVVGCPAYLARHGIPVEPQDLTHHRCCNIRLPT